MPDLAPRGGRFQGRLVILLCAVVAAIGLCAPAAPAAPRVVEAGQAARSADRALVREARAAARCRRRCGARDAAVQRAGRRFGVTVRRFASTVRTTSFAAGPGRAAPAARAVGDRVSWRRVSRARVFVLRRSVPGEDPAYSLVRGTGVRPPAVAGATVRYAVRTAVAASRFGTEATIAHPERVAVGRSSALDAPTVAVRGDVLRWSRVRGRPNYLVLRREEGAADSYRVVRATTWRMRAVPGRTVTYAVRTITAGSAWTPAQTVGSASAPAPSGGSGTAVPGPAVGSRPAGPVPPASAAPAFRFGVISGSGALSQLSAVRLVGARYVRMEWDISTPVASIAPTVEAYARAGVQPLLLAGFPGRLPTAAEIVNVARWAAAFGPGGSLWAGKVVPPGAQVTHIELGNETNQRYQYGTGTDSGDPAFVRRAQEYATQLREAGVAVRAANAAVGVLGVADSNPAWMTAMFDAVPDLGSYVAGWTIHAYGPGWSTAFDALIAWLRARGVPDRPLWVTEWGLASDGGRCLSDNYGWNRCMSYAEAASTLQSVVAEMRARYGARLGAFFLYSLSDLTPSGSSSDRENYFGALKRDRTEKGAFTPAVKALLAASD